MLTLGWQAEISPATLPLDENLALPSLSNYAVWINRMELRALGPRSTQINCGLVAMVIVKVHMIADIKLMASSLITYHGLPATAKILVHSCKTSPA